MAFKHHYASYPRSRSGFTLTEISIVLLVFGVFVTAVWTISSTVYRNRMAARASEQLMEIMGKIDSMAIVNSAVINFNPGTCYCVASEGSTAACGPCSWPACATTYVTGNATTNINAALIGAGIIPLDMITGNTTPDSAIYNYLLAPPWVAAKKTGWFAGALNISASTSYSGAGCNVNASLITFDFGSMPPDICIKILQPNIRTWVTLGLFQIVNGGADSTPCHGFYGITPKNYLTMANASCPDAAGGLSPNNIATFCQDTGGNSNIVLSFQSPAPND